MKSIPSDAKPFSIDIKSMYSNIPIEEGIEAFKQTLDERSQAEKAKLPTEFLVTLLKQVLEGNIFDFNRELWIQSFGTAMGTKVAPTYATLFMRQLEEHMLDTCPEEIKKHIFTWR